MPLRLAALLLCSVALAGCRTSALSVEPSTPDRSALEALYWERVAEDRSQYVQADVDFMSGMIGHHAQALVMSQFAQPNGADAAVRTLASRIMNAQRDEIAAMQKWLRDRDEPVITYRIDGARLILGLEGQPDGTPLPDAGTHDHRSMPGMLSQGQLDELAAARGRLFDRLFLHYMIGHHGGAVTMVDELLDAGGANLDRASFKLASDINADQTTEIVRMRQMLEARGGAPALGNRRTRPLTLHFSPSLHPTPLSCVHATLSPARSPSPYWPSGWQAARRRTARCPHPRLPPCSNPL